MDKLYLVNYRLTRFTESIYDTNSYFSELGSVRIKTAHIERDAFKLVYAFLKDKSSIKELEIVNYYTL